jgi:hypothetical protein
MGHPDIVALAWATGSAGAQPATGRGRVGAGQACREDATRPASRTLTIGPAQLPLFTKAEGRVERYGLGRAAVY